MRNWRLVYWLITGFVIGSGLVSEDLPFIALPLILIGLTMLIAGIFRLKSREWWALLIGLGGIPAAIVVFDIVTAGPPCASNTITLPPGAISVACSSMSNSYYVFALVFALITLLGVSGLLLRRNRVQR